METPTNDCAAFAASLGLRAQIGDLFVGDRDGFPIALKIIDPGIANLLLFQIRHWLPENDPHLKSLVYAHEITQLLEDKKIEIEFGDNIAWVTLNKDAAELRASEVGQTLDLILNTFKLGCLIGDPSVCHYCRKQPVESMSVIEGKVAQICDGCLEDRIKKKRRETPQATSEAVPILLMAPWAAAVGAILWAAFWVGHTLLFEWSSTNAFYIPRILFVVIMVIIGVLAGGPVGWIIKQNKRRGAAAAKSGAIIFGTLAVFVGELIYLAWLIYHKADIFSFSAAIHFMPRFYLSNDVFFLFFRAFAAVAAVVAAHEIAKPPKATLKI